MDRRTIVVVVALSLLLVAAQGEREILSFDAWLEAASGPLASAIVGVVLSWVIEFAPAYESLAPRYERLGYLGLCMVVPMAAARLRAALGCVAWSFDPLVWHAMWNGAVGGTLFHARCLQDAGVPCPCLQDAGAPRGASESI